jgi:uncharacterized protein (TIRG00374 family)
LKRRKILSFLLGIGISAVLLFLILRNIDFQELYTALNDANYYWLIPNIFFVMLAMFQRAERWKYMLAPISSVSYGKLLAATCVGFMANNVLPLRLGEFVRAYSLSKQDNRITKSASLATIFIERIVFDLLALLLILTVIIIIAPMKIMEGDHKYAVMGTLGVAIIGLLFAVAVVVRPEGAGRLMTKYLFFLPGFLKSKVAETVMKFSKGLLFLKDLKYTAWVAGHTILIWLFMGISNIFIFFAFGFDLPIYASYILLIVVSISILIPSAPGFIGVYHAGVVFTLSRFGIDTANAVSCALVLHAAQYIPITLMGFYYMKKAHLSLKQLEADALKGENNG